MSYAEELWGHFYSMDTNEDKFLDSTEMLEYLNKNKTDGKHRKKNNQLRYEDVFEKNFCLHKRMVQLGKLSQISRFLRDNSN